MDICNIINTSEITTQQQIPLPYSSLQYYGVCFLINYNEKNYNKICT